MGAKPDQFSPGPWAPRQAGSDWVHDAKGGRVARVSSHRWEGPERQQADAALIAAAPAMLEALRVIARCQADETGGVTLGSYEQGIVGAAIMYAQGGY